MKPILFAENSTVFTSNGIGRLSDAVSCTVTEERNGMYELEMVYPSTGVHFEDIAIRSIIVVLPYIGASLQPFRVYQITRPINGQVTIRAQHISYDLSKNTTMPFSVQASVTACNDALQGLKTNAVETCPFTFWTDVTTNASYSQTAPATIRSRLGGVEGSILDQFHGEYEWDVYTVKFHDERGADNGVVLRYGKNITDIKQDTNIANTITGVVPYWVNYDGTERVTLPEKVVYAPNASAYSQHLTVPLDFSSNYQEAPTESALRAAAQAYINNHDLGVPKVSVDVSFVNLADTEEYKDEVNMLQTVHLCDEITVEFESLGISTKAQIVKYEWDVLSEKYNNLSVGSIRSSLVTTLNDQNAQLMEQIVKAGQSSSEATSWLTQFGGYVVAIKDENGKWEALAFSDDPDPTKNTANVLLVNQNGLGFSSTGIYGTFTNAWTIDGKLSADFIQAGTMQADRINGGILKLGGINNANGVLSILSAPDLEIGRWDKNGITIAQGSISGSTLSFGSGALKTELKYGPSASFGGSNAFQMVGNDRMAIESTGYQVRAAGKSFHSGTMDGTAYVDINTDYATMYAAVGSAITSADYVRLSNGTAELRVTSDKVVISTGSKLTLYEDLYSNGRLTFRNLSDANEAVTLDVIGTRTNALEHLATGNYVKWTSASDIRTKKDIHDLDIGFVRKFFDSIRPIDFKYKRDEKKKTHYGLIAQELEEVFEDLGQNTDIIGELHNEEKTKFIDYPGLIGICLSAIKDLYARVSELELKIKEA